MTLLIQDIPYHRPLLQNSHWKKNALHCHMIQSFFHCFRLVDLGYLHHLYFGCLIRLSGVVFAGRKGMLTRDRKEINPPPPSAKMNDDGDWVFL